MKRWLKYLVVAFMLIGVGILIEQLVFLASHPDVSDHNAAYAKHLPPFLGLSGGADVFFFLAGSAFVFLLLPGILFLYYYSEKKRQSYLTFGLMGLCLGLIMMWWNM